MAVAYLEQSHAQALLRALAAIRPNSKRANMPRRRWYGMPCFRRPQVASNRESHVLRPNSFVRKSAKIARFHS